MFLHLIGVLLLVGPTHSFFQGCFPLTNWNSLTKKLDANQNNRKCIEFCRQRYHSLAATSGVNCVCMDKLPSKAHALASEGDAAAGPNSDCNVICPGDAGTQCHGENCCGGPEDAFSVYATGDVDIIDKLMSKLLTKKDAILEKMNVNPATSLFSVYGAFRVRMAGNSERQCAVIFLKTLGAPMTFKGCADITEDNPAIPSYPTVGLRVDSVEKELSTSSAPQSQSLGRYDVELDNTIGQTEATLTRSREVSSTTGQTYTTETGTESTVSVGASVSAGFDAFGAEFSVELSTEFSHSSFYNYGYESSNEETITDTFEISIPVRPGTRVAARFSKKFEDHTLKWRSTVYAADTIRLFNVYEDSSMEISLSELLTSEERIFHGFGTIIGEAHPTVTVTIETFDADGNLIQTRPANEQEAHVVSSNRKRDPAKPGDSKKNPKKSHKHHH